MPIAGIRVGLLAAGAKGFGFALDVLERCPDFDVRIICTYGVVGTDEPGVDQFRSTAARFGVEIVDSRHPDLSAIQSLLAIDIFLVVGWQFLVDDPKAVPVVVLHDSILPRLRGFNPTVTALIEGATELGVTAFLPTTGIDEGPVVAQRSVSIEPPMRIAAALEAIRECYLRAAQDVVAAMRVGPLVGDPQDESLATYSMWRDNLDYRLDLSMDASKVVRTIFALGPPYRGAVLELDGRPVRVLDACEVPDLPFVQRSPGKVWRLDPEGPVVVCGSGMVRLTHLEDENRVPVEVTRLRTRFGSELR